MKSDDSWTEVVRENGSNSRNEDDFVQENGGDSSDEDISLSDYTSSSNGSEDSFEDVGLLFSKPFDTDMLKNSIETGCEVLDKVKGKNVVLVLGKTGTGKSTFIQGIAGKQLQMTTHSTECGDITVENSVYSAKDALEDFKIGHEKASETKAFSCFVPEESVGDEGVVYMDTPGFEDTNHPEVDIATSVMLSRVAKVCKSIRFVVLVNCTSLKEDRGGPARSILRFTHAFVKDFSKDKGSFMFLFTHANEISGVSGSVKSSRKSLLDELLRLKKGTDRSDQDLLKLLKLLIASLQKTKHPFVDVLHPLESDFKKLKKIIETKQKHIENPAIAENCRLTLYPCLTGTSLTKLRAEIRDLLLKISSYLQSNTPDAKSAQINHELLQYLGNQIGLREAKEAASESTAHVEAFIGDQKSMIQDRLKKATDDEGVFRHHDAVEVRECLHRLEHVGAEDLSKVLNEISETVSCMAETICFSKAPTSNSSVRKLSKMQSWTVVFPEYKGIYENVLLGVKESIADTIAQVTGFKFTADTDSETISIFTENICFLESIIQQERQLLHHELDLSSTNGALTYSHGMTDKFLSSLPDENSFDLKAYAENEAELKDLIIKLGILDLVFAGIDSQKRFEDLASRAHQSKTGLQAHISFQFEDLCNAAKHMNIGELHEPLHKLRAIYESCDAMTAVCPVDVRQNYHKLLDVVEEKFRSASASLPRVQVTLDSALCTINGKEAGLALGGFSELIWFDSFLPDESPIVSAVQGEILADYERVCKEYREKVAACLELDTIKTPAFGKMPNSEHSKIIAALEEVECIYGGFLEIEVFAKLIQNENMLDDCGIVRSKMSWFATKMVEVMEDAVAIGELRCREDLTPEVFLVMLDEFLKLIEHLQPLADSVGSGKLEGVKKQIVDTVASFSHSVQDELASAANFDSMAGFISILARLEDEEKMHICRLLPSSVQAKEQARYLVLKHAEKVSRCITETSNWEEIDKLIKVFEDAVALDVILNGEIAFQVKTFKTLSEKKEEKVDLVIDEMIASGDYAGIFEFLSPLAESRDQLKKEKFHRYHSEVERSLKKCGFCLDNTSNRLPSSEVTEAAIRSLNGLEEAHRSHWESYSEQTSRISELCELRNTLATGARSLKFSLNTLLKHALAKMETDLRNTNLARLASNRTNVSQYVQMINNHIDVANKNMHEKLEKDYDDLLLSVSRHAEEFIKTWFKKGKLLVGLLRALEQVPQSDQPETLRILELYKETKESLNKGISTNLKNLESGINGDKCYEEGIAVLRSLQRHVDSGLKEHLSSENIIKMKELMDLWLLEQSDCDAEFSKLVGHSEQYMREVAEKLDTLDPSTTDIIAWAWRKFHSTKYHSLRHQTENDCAKCYNKGISALRSSNFVLVKECLKELYQWNEFVHHHISSISRNIIALQDRLSNTFLSVCKQLHDVLQRRSRLDYVIIFDKFRKLILEVPLVLKNEQCTQAFVTTNNLFCSKLESEVSKTTSALTLETTFDFFQIRTIVENTRAFGDFMADYYLVFIEEYRCLDCAQEDPSMKNIIELCHEHFLAGRNFGNAKHYIALGVVPSASYEEIKRAYQSLVRRYHPDKIAEPNENTDERFRTIQEAWEAVRATHLADSATEKKAFDQLVYGIGECLVGVVRQRLSTRKYDVVAQILDRLDSMRDLQALVSKPLETKHVEERVHKLVRSCVSQARISLKTNWAERKYKEVQEYIDDLKSMERHLKSHPEVFEDSWDDGIGELIEGEVVALQEKARRCLISSQAASEGKDDFRFLFLQMGCVLVELPLFKDFAKRKMSSLLDHCLEKHWGYPYIIGLGHSLAENDKENPNHSRVGQLILSEFSHFQHVVTMVWNEEIFQKPARETVKGIKTSLPEDRAIKQGDLLDYFDDVECEYNFLLAEYLCDSADMDSLVQQTTKIADQMKPLISCDEGWTGEIKSKIPSILAGVFALFTVLKSGDAYNKLNSSEDMAHLSEKVLLKPHNIQVLTLLCMFGCGRPSETSLESQLMQIRTGEGKSIILGAAATVLALLGFRVRCVCYSKYLSDRDYALFEDVFKYFEVAQDITYSMIDTFSEDRVAAKGNIRDLTKGLLRGKLSRSSERSAGGEDGLHRQNEDLIVSPNHSSRQEILLVDEVDVFFGEEFYGKTYNHGVSFWFDEAVEILKMIWNDAKCGGRLRLSDLKSSKPYNNLQQKLDGFTYVIDNEISKMLRDVRKVDQPPYVLDKAKQRIGYRIMDSVSYRTSYGYRTHFAYLREYDQGNVGDNSLRRYLSGLEFRCGMFSYAAIEPTRILGVSGTLDVMTRYEKEVLARYGVETYLYIPSVYGDSNFSFDQAGEGISIESNKSNFFHKICANIKSVTEKERAVIVFFKDAKAVKEFESSPFFDKLGNSNKEVLSETMIPSLKDFVISKAATAGQITISSAAFGRGTDFFCKDDTVENNGGVHVIQAFLSEQRSEEVQIQGRTARQGKRGSYQLIVLEDDLVETFGIRVGEKDTIAKSDRYKWLCDARDRHLEEDAKNSEEKFAEATENDKMSHEYLDALVQSNHSLAASLFKRNYEKFEKQYM